jgi:hypothetical protein
MRERRVHFKGTVSLATVQVNRYRHNRNVGHDQRVNHHLANACASNARGQKFNHIH